MLSKNFLKTILLAMLISACASPYPTSSGGDTPLNLIPMYGYPDARKTEAQKKADDRFIKTMTADGRSRESGSKEFASRGWYYLQQGDRATSMRHFNQAWLLDQDNYWSYWGFGVLLKTEDKAAEAIPHFEKALQLVSQDDDDKVRLLLDAADAYANQGKHLKGNDNVKSVQLYEKASSLVNEGVNIAPHFTNTYRVGAQIYYDRGMYEKAWEMVHNARPGGKAAFGYKFLDRLTRELPEPEK